jgi:flavin reductase (DIM6/NTAB) family NADH-FMN oxidoreductase RutF
MHNHGDRQGAETDFGRRYRPRREGMIEPQEFRNALGRFATGVTVVTVMDGEEPHGITVNSFMSVSLVPPLIAVAIGRSARAHELLTAGRHFGVSVLRRGQEQVSDMFADRPVVVSDPLVLADGFPFVAESLARLLCRVSQSHDAGDHTIYVGEVERLAYYEGKPLLYHRGRYVGDGELEVAERD